MAQLRLLQEKVHVCIVNRRAGKQWVNTHKTISVVFLPTNTAPNPSFLSSTICDMYLYTSFLTSLHRSEGEDKSGRKERIS